MVPIVSEFALIFDLSIYSVLPAEKQHVFLIIDVHTATLSMAKNDNSAYLVKQ